jgi:GcrA cell cycle regulator
MEWTAERVEALKTLWTEGNTASEVSRRLGVTRNAVIGKVHRLGMGGRLAAAAPRAIAAQTPRRTRARSNPNGTHFNRSGAATPAAPSRPKFVERSDFLPTASLLTLNAHGCRWPIGHPDRPEFGFCGRERPANTSYCADHQKVAFRRSSFSSTDVKRLAGLG